MIYYLYTHTRLDTNEVFYVGIGRTKTNSYGRAYAIGKTDRNNLWLKIYEKIKGSIQVDIIKTFDNLKSCQDAEIYFIKTIGRKIYNEGPLANLSPGGELKSKEPKKILQYSKEGHFIKKYDNIIDAASECNVTFKAISQAIKNKGTSGGYQWKWYTEGHLYSLLIEEYKNSRSIEIYQFTKKCTFLTSYSSISEASKLLNIDEHSISKVISGKRKSAGGFYWTNNKKACKDCQQRKKIDKYSLNNEFIKTYDTMEEIKKELKIKSSTAIRNCFEGKQKQAYGYIWKKNLQWKKDLV